MTTLNNKDGHNFFIPATKVFNPNEIKRDYVNETLNFAYAMTFGSEGAHRDHRTGGQAKRKNGEIFINAFQGKLAEYAIYQYLIEKGITVEKPDIDVYDLGKWDSCDFEVNKYRISVKSTKY